MKPLHGFCQDSKWYEDVGHVVLGIFPVGLLLWAREWTDWPLVWPFRGQWPPGDVLTLYGEGQKYWAPTDPEECSKPCSNYAPLDRVSDVGRDELGFRIGATIRNVGLIVLWIM